MRSCPAPKVLRERIRTSSKLLDDFLDLLDAAGIEVTFTVRETAAPMKFRIEGAGPRVRGMVNKVTYDTEAADALSNNFYADGENMYTYGKAIELYIDGEGRYFFAEYFNAEGVRNRITPTTAEDAAAFIERYGTDLHKAPNK